MKNNLGINFAASRSFQRLIRFAFHKMTNFYKKYIIFRIRSDTLIGNK